MKIENIQSKFFGRFMFVEITTDNGITGIGESGAWAFLEASNGAMEKFSRYLIGQDPLRIEHHWQFMYRYSHFRGAAIMGALSAIDIALWDIAGQHYQCPIYELIGGKVRNRARAYCHAYGTTQTDLVQSVVKAKNAGFTAVGHVNPFLDEPRSSPYFKTEAAKIGEAIDCIRECREAVADELDLCVEVHRRLTPTEAVQFCLGIEEYRPMFVEDPVTPDNFDEMEYIASKVNVPLATGERFTSMWEFAMLLRRNAVQYVRPDVCLVGGITATKKIAALAESVHVGVVPHNPLSAVSTAACLQIAACIPNFSIQEHPAAGDDCTENKYIAGAAKHDGEGFLILSEKPGLGVKLRKDISSEISEEESGLSQIAPQNLETRLGIDGSVVDQ